MNRRLQIIKKVVDFFVEEGKILTDKEYKVAKGRPYGLNVVKRSVGNWNRVLHWGEKHFPEEFAKAKAGEGSVKAEEARAKAAEAAKLDAEAMAKAAERAAKKEKLAEAARVANENAKVPADDGTYNG